VRASFARITIERVRYPMVDDQGTLVPDTDQPPTVVPITRCWLEPLASQEAEEGGTATFTGFKGTAPWGTDLLPTDRVRHFGVEYEVDGDVMPVQSPTGALNEVIFTLKRWKHAS
jgi:hypothetical protein